MMKKNEKARQQQATGMNPGRAALLPAALAAALLAIPLTAGAYTITTTQICDAATQACAGSPESDGFKVTIVNDGGTDTQFSIDWLVPAGTVGDSALPVDLAASSTWTIQSFGSEGLLLGVEISNDTDLSGQPGTNSAIVSFGFGVTPNSTVAFQGGGTGSTFDTVETQTGQQNFPGGFKDVDVCVYSAGCSGGNVNEGLQAGGTDTLALQLTPDPGTSYDDTIELLFFPLKFQGTWGSFEPGGGPGDGGDGPGGGVPVPAPLALIGLGALLLRWMTRRTG